MDDEPSNPSALLLRKNVTRACDTCKKRKVKCDGHHPCTRCSQSNICCTYNSSYNRVHGRLAPYPTRKTRSDSARQNPSTPDNQHDVSTSHSPQMALGRDGDTDRIDASAMDEDVRGDASVHGFLQKVSRHLAQIGQGLPRNLFKNYEESDGTSDTSYVSTMVLPDKATGSAYLDAYFDHGNATCRYLPRDNIYRYLDELYTIGSPIQQDHTKMAIILLILGTGCVWYASWNSEAEVSPWKSRALPFLHAAESRLHKVGKSFPPSLEILQAQVLKCQCELLLGRFNSAWMSLGWAVRLGQMIDFQQEPPSPSNILDGFHKRRLFWAMFMIDRYLAVILGRPMMINENDITVALSSVIDETISSMIDSREKKLIVGTTAHYRLTRIIGRAASQLYPVANRDPTAFEQIVVELENEIRGWLEITPKFFHPTEGSAVDAQDQLFDVPWILHRQQRTVQAAFYFTNMLIYRGHLLWDFLRQKPNQFSTELPAERVRKCVDNALSMIRLSANFEVDDCKYNGTFWITSHFVFCAISILVVYLTLCRDSEERSIIEEAVEGAMRFHRKLTNTANISAQKLLDESRSRAQLVQHIKTPTSSTRQGPELEDITTSTAAPDEAWVGISGLDPTGRTQKLGGGNGDDSATLEMLGNPALESFDINDGVDTIMNIGFDSSIYPNFFDHGSHFRF